MVQPFSPPQTNIYQAIQVLELFLGDTCTDDGVWFSLFELFRQRGNFFEALQVG